MRDYYQISEDHVKIVLSTMLNPTHKNVGYALECLKSLVLVDVFLLKPDFPLMENAREFAVFYIFSETIFSNYKFCRMSLGLKEPDSNASLQVCKRTISEEMSQESLELIAWSFLYHCHVRVDLNFSVSQFANVVSAAPRSVRRYREYAIKRLTSKLVEREWITRIEQHRIKLYTQLPFPHSQKLVGREHEIDNIARLFQVNATLKLLITGALGIGKSSLVQHIIQHLIDVPDSNITDLIWIQTPATVQNIYDRLYEKIMMLATPIALRDFFFLNPTLIVIDDAEDVLSNEPQNVNDLLKFLGPSAVVMISNAQVILPNLTDYYLIQELSQEAAYALIQQKQKFSELEPAEVEQVYNTVGGNPLGIELCQVSILETASISIDNLNAFITEAFHILSSSSKTALYACMLCPPQNIDLKAVFILWGKVITLQDITILTRHHLMTEFKSSHQSTHYHITNLVRHYVQSQYLYWKQDHILLEQLINLFSQNMLQINAVLVLEFIHHIKSQTWLNLSINYIKEWSKVLLSINDAKYPHYVGLAADFIKMIDVESGKLEVQLEYGIALRQMGRWDEARIIFQLLLEETGRYGHFQIQSNARLEMSIILKYEGNLQDAQQGFDRCLKEALRYKDQELEDRIYIEQAQLAIDQLEGFQAIHYLQNIRDPVSHFIRRQLLIIEAYLLIAESEMARTLAETLISSVIYDRYILGCAYNLIGRCALQENDWINAHQYFTIAVSYFDPTKDMVAQARGLANLGTVSMRLKRYEEAEECLFTAMKI